MKTYQVLSRALGALERCRKGGMQDRAEEWAMQILNIVKEGFPSGSGFDNGTWLLESESKPEMLVFSTSFHHMNEGGFYDGWTKHKVIVTPSLEHGYVMRITGRDHKLIKELIQSEFSLALECDIARWAGLPIAQVNGGAQ